MAPHRDYGDEKWRAIYGYPLKAGNKRQEIVEEIGSNKGKNLFLFFSGIPTSRDTAFMLATQWLAFTARQAHHERFCVVRSP